MPTGQVAVQVSSPSQDAVDLVVRLYNAIRAPFPEAVVNFQSRWEAVEAASPPQPQSASICDDSCIHTEEFNALAKLGPKIIPFVVYKLANDDSGKNIWGVFLYNALENDPAYRPSLEGHDLRNYSTRIIELNYQRNKIVETRIEAWKQLQRDNFLYSSSYINTMSDEFDALLELGTSIIAPLMVAFHENQNQYWWDLLHEIVNGHKMGAIQYVKSELYASWDDYFRWGEHDQAPDYILSQLDRGVRYGEVVDAAAVPRRYTYEESHR